MDISNIDLTKKENQTLKNWFWLMWGNHYIQIFIFALGVLIAMACTTFQDNSKYLTMSIPFIMCLTIVYGCFYRFWKKQTTK
jgi:hypothetical protein